MRIKAFIADRDKYAFQGLFSTTQAGFFLQQVFPGPLTRFRNRYLSFHRRCFLRLFIAYISQVLPKFLENSFPV